GSSSGSSSQRPGSTPGAGELWPSDRPARPGGAAARQPRRPRPGGARQPARLARGPPRRGGARVGARAAARRPADRPAAGALRDRRRPRAGPHAVTGPGQELTFLSDLHMAAGGPADPFADDAALAALIEDIAAAGRAGGPARRLVLLGDFVDLVIADASGRGSAAAPARP